MTRVRLDRRGLLARLVRRVLLARRGQPGLMVLPEQLGPLGLPDLRVRLVPPGLRVQPGRLVRLVRRVRVWLLVARRTSTWLRLRALTMTLGGRRLVRCPLTRLL